MNLVWIFWGFKLWMLFDVLTRRRGPIVWLALLFLLPSFTIGGVLYFFLVKAIDYGLFRGLDTGRSSARGESVSPAASRMALGQTMARRLEAADALELKGIYPEAILLFESILESQPEDLRALHGLARCRLGTGHPEAAVDLLEKVLAKDREFAHFSAALDYAEALSRTAQVGEAVNLLDGLVKHTGRINHRLALAHYLVTAGRNAEAVRVLEEARASYLKAEDAQKATERRWFEKVEAELQGLAS